MEAVTSVISETIITLSPPQAALEHHFETMGSRCTHALPLPSPMQTSIDPRAPPTPHERASPHVQKYLTRSTDHGRRLDRDHRGRENRKSRSPGEYRIEWVSSKDEAMI